jgi:hypothetical protein
MVKAPLPERVSGKRHTWDEKTPENREIQALSDLLPTPSPALEKRRLLTFYEITG